jgi:hypothetical protein
VCTGALSELKCIETLLFNHIALYVLSEIPTVLRQLWITPSVLKHSSNYFLVSLSAEGFCLLLYCGSTYLFSLFFVSLQSSTPYDKFIEDKDLFLIDFHYEIFSLYVKVCQEVDKQILNEWRPSYK